jgi:hypothetical protein
VAKLTAIMIAELADDRPLVEHHEARAQVDGSFDLAPIAVAVLQEFARRRRDRDRTTA